MIDSRCLYVFGVFSTILQSDFDQWLLKWYWNDRNLLLLTTKENLRQIPVVPLLTDLEPMYQFLIHHNYMTVNCGTRERTCATSTLHSTHWQLLFLVLLWKLLFNQRLQERYGPPLFFKSVEFDVIYKRDLDCRVMFWSGGRGDTNWWFSISFCCILS